MKSPLKPQQMQLCSPQMLSAAADAVRKQKIKRRCAFCVRSTSGRGSYWKWKRQTLKNNTFHELSFKQCLVHNPKSSRNYSVYRFLQKFLADSHFKSWRTIGSVVWRCGRDLCPLNWSSTFTRFAVVGTQVRHTCSTGRAHSSIKCRKPHPL